MDVPGGNGVAQILSNTGEELKFLGLKRNHELEA
jgi:hypothetical protein